MNDQSCASGGIAACAMIKAQFLTQWQKPNEHLLYYRRRGGRDHCRRLLRRAHLRTAAISLRFVVAVRLRQSVLKSCPSIAYAIGGKWPGAPRYTAPIEAVIS